MGEVGKDPFLQYIEATPIDDEPVTPEEQAAVAEVQADRRAGIPTVSFQEVSRGYA